MLFGAHSIYSLLISPVGELLTAVRFTWIGQVILSARKWLASHAFAYIHRKSRQPTIQLGWMCMKMCLIRFHMICVFIDFQVKGFFIGLSAIRFSWACCTILETNNNKQEENVKFWGLFFDFPTFCGPLFFFLASFCFSLILTAHVFGFLHLDLLLIPFICICVHLFFRRSFCSDVSTLVKLLHVVTHLIFLPLLFLHSCRFICCLPPNRRLSIELYSKSYRNKATKDNNQKPKCI